MSYIDLAEINTPEGLAKLDEYMRVNSYVVGQKPSQLDVQIFNHIKNIPINKYRHLTRWFNHISYFNDYQREQWPEIKSDVVINSMKKETTASKKVAKKVVSEMSIPKETQKKEVPPAGAVPAAVDKEEDFDPFASDSEEEQKPITVSIKGEPKPKKVVINKSQIILEVKPNSLSTDLDQLEKLIKEIKINGLEWSVTCKKVPLAFGLMKLQIGCVIVDDLVNTDDIINKIECLGLTEEEAAKKLRYKELGEDGDESENDEEHKEEGEDDDEEEEEEEDLGLVQSVEIVSFNKL